MSDDLVEESSVQNSPNAENAMPEDPNKPDEANFTIEDVQPRDNEIDDANGDLFLDTEDKGLGMSRQLPPKDDRSENNKLPNDDTIQ